MNMIPFILMGVASAFKAVQGYQQSKQSAEIAEQNAQYASELATNKAELEKQKRQMERDEARDMQRRRRAKQEASYATSGVLLDGTPSNYLTAQVQTDQLNLERQDQQSYQRQLGFIHEGQVQATNYLNQAKAYKYSANMSLIGGALSAGAYGSMAMTEGGGFSWMDDAPSTGSGFSDLTLMDGVMPSTTSDPFSSLKLGGF